MCVYGCVGRASILFVLVWKGNDSLSAIIKLCYFFYYYSVFYPILTVCVRKFLGDIIVKLNGN